MGSRRQDAVLEAIERLFRGGTAAGLSDGQLLDRFATRHDEAAEAAFAALLERHGPMVLRLCRRLLADPNDADDAFQATFLILVRKAGAVRDRAALASWLYGVALRVAAQSRAASARRQTVERVAGGRLAREIVPEEPRHELWDEVDRLPERYRVAVVVCYLEGLTHEQAAQRLGWPVGTVRSRLSRARDRLRRRLSARGLAPSAMTSALAFAGAKTQAKSMSLPISLIEPTIKAAMLCAAHDAAEAGLVSATAASLTEGVLRTMFLTKLKSAALVLLTAGAVAGAGAYGYQAPEPETIAVPVLADASQREAPDPPDDNGDDEPRGERNREREKARAHRLASFAERMTALVREASRQQNQGDVKDAGETIRKIGQLAREWDRTLTQPLADEPSAHRDDPAAPRANDAPAPSRRSSRNGERAGTTPGPARALRSDPGPQPPEPTEPRIAPPPAIPPVAATRPRVPRAAMAPTPPPADGDTRRRLDDLERKLDRVLRALEPEGEGPVRPVPARPPVPPRPPRLPVPPATPFVEPES
jgi:RNA polymerase sigma factor (sigma-70 family)